HALGVPFFFQAEDGIRDFHVTGVQTCALPISWPCSCSVLGAGEGKRPTQTGGLMRPNRWRWWLKPAPGCCYCCHCCWIRAATTRSEERRVGKEGKSWGGTAQARVETGEY